MFKKELANYQENMEIGENDIRIFATNKPILHLERLLGEEYERLRKFQEMISSVRARGLFWRSQEIFLHKNKFFFKVEINKLM